jgi:hypothetical protein
MDSLVMRKLASMMNATRLTGLAIGLMFGIVALPGRAAIADLAWEIAMPKYLPLAVVADCGDRPYL